MPTSVTVVMPDGTIWTAGTFTQVTPPPAEKTIDLEPGESVDVEADEASTQA